MAGNGYSGRRPTAKRNANGQYQPGGDDGRLTSEDGEPPDFGDDPPPLNDLDTPEQVRLASQWVWRQQCRRLFDARTADALNNTLKTALQSIRTAHGLDEIQHLRELVQRMEAATGVQRSKANQERHASVSSSTTTTLGRRLATDDNNDKH